ncbi:MAG: hypothetical protein IPH38_18480 [Candidatus Microthrix sp.]|nr:hypothetical protein [Candidatus Microthrix sp.]MBK7021521.1 hypothetical protein [Candidatus Microthrix sp.]
MGLRLDIANIAGARSAPLAPIAPSAVRRRRAIRLRLQPPPRAAPSLANSAAMAAPRLEPPRRVTITAEAVEGAAGQHCGTERVAVRGRPAD